MLYTETIYHNLIVLVRANCITHAGPDYKRLCHLVKNTLLQTKTF